METLHDDRTENLYTPEVTGIGRAKRKVMTDTELRLRRTFTSIGSLSNNTNSFIRSLHNNYLTSSLSSFYTNPSKMCLLLCVMILFFLSTSHAQEGTWNTADYYKREHSLTKPYQGDCYFL